MSKRPAPQVHEPELDDEEEEGIVAPRPARPGRNHRVDGDAGDDVEMGDVDSLGNDSSLRSVLDDPENEDEPDLSGVANEEVDEVEQMDLTVFAGPKGRGYEDDSFEEWVRISRKHGNLTQEEIDFWLNAAHGENEDMAREAEDVLIRHNVKWIVRCLRSHPLVGSDIMDMPGGLRDDALSLGRMGFLMGIRKYDPERALKYGKEGHKKSLLKYGEYWIGKLAGEFMHQERFLLPEDASLDRKKVMSAQAALEKELKRPPTDDEISERLDKDTRHRVARDDLRAELGRAPTPEEITERIDSFGPKEERRLRRRGALLPDRIRELREHQTHRPSIDAPSQSDSDSPSLGDYVSGDEEGLDDRMVNSEMYSDIIALSKSAGDPKMEFLARIYHNLVTDNSDELIPPFRGEEAALALGLEEGEPFSKEEGGMLLGRSRGSVETYESEHRRRMIGETEVSSELLTREGFGFHVQGVRAVVQSAEKGGDAGQEELAEMKARIEAAAYLPEILIEDKVGRDPRSLREGVCCPLDESGTHQSSNSFRADASGFTCDDCGVKGDIFDWFRLRYKMQEGEAVIEAARRVIGVPQPLTKESGQVVVVRNPTRRERVRRLN